MHKVHTMDTRSTYGKHKDTRSTSITHTDTMSTIQYTHGHKEYIQYTHRHKEYIFVRYVVQNTAKSHDDRPHQETGCLLAKVLV